MLRGFVAGPGLIAAVDETTTLAGRHGGHLLVDAAATVAGCLDLVRRVDLLHIASHGRFRDENPLLSSLQLVDGALTIHDLGTVAELPEVVVLAACEAARSTALGEQVLGFAHALLGLGVRSVIAPTFAVPDDSTARFMVGLHRHLADGHGPAAALALAQREADPTNSLDLLASWSFVCITRRTPPAT